MACPFCFTEFIHFHTVIQSIAARNQSTPRGEYSFDTFERGINNSRFRECICVSDSIRKQKDFFTT